ncbi:phospholipase-like protein, partial [Tanacetum coccineum]
EYEAKVVITSKLRYFSLFKEKLNENRRKLFRKSCFGKWLDISFYDNEPHFIDYILQKQVFVDDAHYDMPLVYNVEGRFLHFGRPEFSLITGLHFGTYSFRKFKSGDVTFVSRVLPYKLGLKVSNLDLLGLIEDEELFGKLDDDDDAVRVCLLLALEVIFIGKKLVDEVPDTLMRLVENLVVWNDFRWGEYIWRHLYDQIMNVVNKNKWEHLKGLSKSQNYVPTYTLSGFVWSFKVNLDLTPTILEQRTICSLHQQGWKMYQDLPIIRRCYTTSVEEIRLKDGVITKLNSWVFKLEAIIKVLGRERRRSLLKQEEEERFRLEEHKMIKICFLKLCKRRFRGVRKRKDAQLIIGETTFAMAEKDRPLNTLNDQDMNLFLKDVTPWVEHVELWVNYMWHFRPHDAYWAMVGACFVQLLLQDSIPSWYADGSLYKVSWCDVEEEKVHGKFIYWAASDRCGLHDDGVMHTSHSRLLCAWVLEVNGHSVTSYRMIVSVTTPYSSRLLGFNMEEEPIIEVDDIGYQMDTTLQAKIPEVMMQAKVFDQKGIDHTRYTISFTNAVNVPKQGGVFGDYGICTCNFLYRLSHGLLLDVDNPIQTTLAYRGHMAELFLSIVL